MVIDGFEKLTLLDYPGNIACIIFTRGCNLRCPFCQNGTILDFKTEKGKYSEDEIFEYLNKRKNVLDGICITGGEPLLQPDIKEFIQKVKKLNLKVKLDTNGTNYLKLKELVDEKLVDYVAMDVKNTFSKYPEIAGKKDLNVDNIKKSINFLKKGNVDYEFRTTIVKDFHTFEDIEEICKMIGKESKYYLQNFVNSENVLESKLEGYQDEELQEWKAKLKETYEKIEIR